MQLLPKETFVKVTFRCDELVKPLLKNSTCLVHISVGQDYHEGEKFIATMDLINDTFQSCILVICDTLQRYSLKIFNPDLTEEDAYSQSLKSGQQWLSRNENAFNYLNIPFKLFGWDHWLNDSDYMNFRKEIENLYKNNEEYRYAIQSTIDKFLKRHSKILSTSDRYRKAFELSEAYLMEEMPVLVPLWAKTNCNFVIYPRQRSKAMAITLDYFLQNNKINFNVLNEISLKFNRRINPKKLNFSYMDFLEKLEAKTEMEIE